VALHRVKQFKDLELSYDAADASGMTVTFYTDMPSSGGTNIMALRKTLTFPQSSGRRTYTLPLDTASAYPEGTLYRIQVASAGVVKLYGGVMRVRGIGVYFDGANSESWRTQDIGIGI
jgi:hypothetical protein